MRVTVVYQCMFGNTYAVAEAVAAGARDAGPGTEVVVRPAWDAPHAALAGTGLLIAGGPSHAPGFGEWLDALPAAQDGSLGAAFDTRDGYRLAGGAAHDIGRSLENSGYGLVARPEGFVVWGTEGPLRAGERQRARRWGAQVMITALARLPQPRP